MNDEPKKVPRPRLRLPQLVNMNFGFLGIQFGWALQMANMSAIYEVLDAEPDEIPILWLAAPLTGLIVQPIIGSLSDRTWTRLGRRRPYFLVGAVLASVTLFFMPTVEALWMAALGLWILDASINVSMEPFRAFVSDKLPDDQLTSGFAMQSLLIGIGTTLANLMPWALAQFGVTGNAANGVPSTVAIAFQVGAVGFLLAVLWTIFTTSEDPPEVFAARSGHKPEKREGWIREIGSAFVGMPHEMKRLAVVQVFTWLGLFCMWIYFGPTTARYIFGATDPESPKYAEGIEWAGVCFAGYSVVTFFAAMAIPRIAMRYGRRVVHAGALVIGGVALLSLGLVDSPEMLLVVISVGVGVAWASILSLPYAMLTRAIPSHRAGVYLGIFNFFIVIPEILAALLLQPVVKHVFGNNTLFVVMAGGGSLLIAAMLVSIVPKSVERQVETAA